MKKILVLMLALSLVLMGLCACEKNNYRTDVTATQVMDAVLAAVPAEGGYRQVSQGYISSSTWGADYQTLLDKVTDYHIVVAEDSDMNINEIGVFRVTNQSDVTALTAIVQTFVTGQVQRYTSLLEAYNPDEMPKLSEAEVKVCDTYIFYSILSDANTKLAQDALVASVSLS